MQQHHRPQRRPLGQGVRKAANTVTLEHKIKLKKRLAKAYKKLDDQPAADISLDSDRLEEAEPHMIEKVQEALSVPQKKKFLTATKAPPRVQHQTHKPDPLKMARNAQAEVEAARAADQARREEEISVAVQKREESRRARFDKKKKMTARTRKGQPVLSHHIDSLLEKIQRSMN